MPSQAQSIAPAAGLWRVALLGGIVECGSMPLLSGCGMWGVGLGSWCSMGAPFRTLCNMRYMTPIQVVKKLDFGWLIGFILNEFFKDSFGSMI